MLVVESHKPKSRRISNASAACTANGKLSYPIYFVALIHISVAQVIYLLSTLIQLRTSFPPPPPVVGNEDYNLFSTLPEFQLTGSLFDWSYVLSALVGAAVWWVDERIN
jgi:hypothetical protein